ncbi:hypothetical protein MPH_13351 [Macrophomina phaseolina MS6]|uniref:Protein kinase domain-containing protein n=1 Tax=Macrophomina phaseolina (strain MS6) TaxID=1126212 RepID=K2RHJ6_MACPH|nr:hypothetical protein MPH_13351 [Macrophomina phaseolina MS6]
MHYIQPFKSSYSLQISKCQLLFERKYAQVAALSTVNMHDLHVYMQLPNDHFPSMPQRLNFQRKCCVPGWTQGGHRVIRPCEQNATFQPLRVLSKGTTDKVEVVRLVPSPRDSVVCKRISLDSWQTAKKEAIVRDIKRLKALDYQHIIAVVGTYQAANEYGILMSPFGEQNLEAFLTQLNSRGDEQHQQHKTWLHGWFSCIASALFYIHDNGLLHREIEPKNIIHRGSEVYSTDFGLRSSTALYAQTTTAYSAPETERPESRHTQCSDIFSLGCVYLEMLIARDN